MENLVHDYDYFPEHKLKSQISDHLKVIKTLHSDKCDLSLNSETDNFGRMCKVFMVRTV